MAPQTGVPSVVIYGHFEKRKFAHNTRKSAESESRMPGRQQMTEPRRSNDPRHELIRQSQAGSKMMMSAQGSSTQKFKTMTVLHCAGQSGSNPHLANAKIYLAMDLIHLALDLRSLPRPRPTLILSTRKQATVRTRQ